MRYYFMYDGVSSENFDAFLSGKDTFRTASRDVEEVSVSGRNGNLLFDNGAFKNVEQQYRVFIWRNFEKNYGALRDFLMSRIGYKRLEDMYHPKTFRLAAISNDLQPDVGKGYQTGGFDLKFTCKPQSFLKSGENKIEITNDTFLFNPTHFEAKPLIRIYGKGVLGVGDKVITVIKADDYTDVDCDTESAYKGSENCNGNIEIANFEFPSLPEGKTGIHLGDGISKIEIIPRWWTL